jgi:hypothetical protein
MAVNYTQTAAEYTGASSHNDTRSILLCLGTPEKTQMMRMTDKCQNVKEIGTRHTLRARSRGVSSVWQSVAAETAVAAASLPLAVAEVLSFNFTEVLALPAGFVLAAIAANSNLASLNPHICLAVQGSMS